jgi:Mediator complex subunit MED14
VVVRWSKHSESVQKCMVSHSFRDMETRTVPDQIRNGTEHHQLLTERRGAVRLCSQRTSACFDGGPVASSVCDDARLILPTVPKHGAASPSVRNYDLTSALDILTTGSYQRLPSILKVRAMIHDPFPTGFVNFPTRKSLLGLPTCPTSSPSK